MEENEEKLEMGGEDSSPGVKEGELKICGKMVTRKEFPKDVRSDASPEKEDEVIPMNPMEVAKGTGKLERDEVVDIVVSELRSGSTTIKEYYMRK